MKNLIIAAITATTLTAGAASAEDLSFLAGVEYAVEAEVLEATAGVEYSLGQLTLTPMVTLNDVGGDFDFSSAELTVSYSLTEQGTVYVTVETDDDFEYSETTLGVAFKF
jgi:hypothetical protein